MQNTNEIRRHIAAVAETRKITGAMELVSSARLKQAMRHIQYNNEYLARVQATMKDILLSPHEVDHPYLRTGLAGKRLYIVVAADKGMVGSYNSDVLNYAMTELEHDEGDYMLATIGLVTGEYFRRRGIEPDMELPGLSQDPSLVNARHLANDVLALFDNYEVRSIYIIYTPFVRAGSLPPVCRRLLPIRIHDYSEVESNAPTHEILYEPSANEVFGQLIPQYLVGLIFGALVQSFAAEHFSRMNAMHSATDNADELLKNLDRQYNMARQTQITQEIAENSGAAEALKKS